MEGKRLPSKVAGGGGQSPERERRKDKWATERQEIPVEDQGTRRRRLQDPVALEDNADEGNHRPSKRGRPDGFDGRSGRSGNGNPQYVPRTGYFFQHDDRSSWRPRPFVKRRPFGEDRRPVRKIEDRWTGGVPEEPSKDEARWRHDRFLQTENGNRDAGSYRGSRPFEGRSRDHNLSRRSSNRMSGRGGFHNTVVERGRWGDREPQDGRGSGFPRGGKLRGRGRESRTQDEWKHDLFNDNARPAAKREEESVARAEALLSS